MQGIIKEPARSLTMLVSEGNPKSVKVVGISNRPIRCVIIPRLLIAEVRKDASLRVPALYIRVKQGEGSAYVGESDNFAERIADHYRNKEDWDYVLVFIDANRHLSKTHVRYLEALAIARAKEADRVPLTNTANPSVKDISDIDGPFVRDFFSDIEFIMSALDFKIFDKATTTASKSKLWYLKNLRTDSRGVYEDGNFTVLSGSIVDIQNRKSYNRLRTARAERRPQLIIENGKKLEGSDTKYTLVRSLTFNSPSEAAAFCNGGDTNGWVEWKNDAGATMDEIIRKQLNA